MSSAIITVEGLGKKYRLQHQQQGQRYVALRDVIAEKAKGFFKKLKSENLKSGNDFSVSASQNVSVSRTEDFWALKDVSFEVRQGEVVGIIGRNGAGKSTLLKILSRITEPTEGRVRIKGRVASLLEVGTGFHPELTGRENVFLNGAILGMHRAEIKRKFDEIVAFAEVEKFLDTPVKRYSSGMYVRLAFAVAAHLEPEILIVDEVLAVGDAEFQKKCLGKMESVSRKEGRTVIFVSHNMAAILDLCSRGVVLNQGKTAFLGDVEKACAEYTRICRNLSKTRRTTGIFRSVSLVDEQGNPTVTFNGIGALRFRCAVRLPEEGCLVSIIIRDSNAHALFELFDKLFSPPCRVGSDVELQIDAGNVPLRPGQYSVDFWCGNRFAQRLEFLDKVLEFDVVTPENTGPNAKLYGPFRFSSTWQVSARK